MAVAIGGTPTGTTANSVSSLAVNHTASGTDLAGAFGVGVSAGGTVPAINGATWGGNAMSAAFASITTGGTRQRQFYIAGSAVSTSAQSVRANLSAIADEVVISAVSFQGVDSATPIGTPVTSTASSQTPSVTVLNISDDGMLFDFVYAVSNPPDLTTANSGPGANQILGTEHLDPGGFAYGGSSYQDGVDGGVMSWSLGALPDFGTTLGAFEFKPAAGGGADPIRLRFPMSMEGLGGGMVGGSRVN